MSLTNEASAKQIARNIFRRSRESPRALQALSAHAHSSMRFARILAEAGMHIARNANADDTDLLVTAANQLRCAARYIDAAIEANGTAASLQAELEASVKGD